MIPPPRPLGTRDRAASAARRDADLRHRRSPQRAARNDQARPPAAAPGARRPKSPRKQTPRARRSNPTRAERPGPRTAVRGLFFIPLSFRAHARSHDRYFPAGISGTLSEVCTNLPMNRPDLSKYCTSIPSSTTIWLKTPAGDCRLKRDRLHGVVPALVDEQIALAARRAESVDGRWTAFCARIPHPGGRFLKAVDRLQPHGERRIAPVLFKSHGNQVAIVRQPQQGLDAGHFRGGRPDCQHRTGERTDEAPLPGIRPSFAAARGTEPAGGQRMSERRRYDEPPGMSAECGRSIAGHSVTALSKKFCELTQA